MRSIILVILIAACGRGADDDGDDDAPGAVGQIRIEETELGSVIGTVASVYARFQVPDDRPDLVNDGTCRVYEYPCLGSVGACGQPPAVSAGTIAITGLATAITLEPSAETHDYPGPGSLPDDLFADTATIAVTAAGDTITGFTLGVIGVEPMISPYVDAPLGVVPGQPLDLAWTAGTSGASIQFRVNWADVCHAGAEWYVLVCDVADTGAYSVPAAVTGALPATGFSHCGAYLARFRRDVVSDPGREVELYVGNADWFGSF